MGFPIVDDYADMVLSYAEPVILRRSSPLTFDQSTGRYSQPTNFLPDQTIDAVAYPTSDRESKILPEGVRSSQLLTLFTLIELNAASAKLNLDGDVIIYRGDKYEVQHTQDWKHTGNYFRSLALRVAPDGQG